MDVTLEPLVDVAPALPAATISCAAAAAAAAAANGEPAATNLPPPTIAHHHASGNMAAAAVAAVSSPMIDVGQDRDQGLVLGGVAVAEPPVRDDNIVRALAFAEEHHSAARASAHAQQGCSRGGGGGNGNGGTANGSGSNVSSAMDVCGANPPGSDARPPPPLPPPPSSTPAEAFAASLGLAESSNGVVTSGGAGGGQANGEAPGAGGSAPDNSSDVGSADEDSEDYTWFSSERRSSGGERKHGRGRARNERVYDRVRINDHADVSSLTTREVRSSSCYVVGRGLFSTCVRTYKYVWRLYSVDVHRLLAFSLPAR